MSKLVIFRNHLIFFRHNIKLQSEITSVVDLINLIDLLKKFLSIPAITLSLSLGYSGIASAGIWSPSAAWGPQQASYAPDYGNTSMYEYVATTSGNTFVSPKARFRFTQNAVNAIKNYNARNGYFYTFDISVTEPNNRTLSAYKSGYYCTLPNCKFDVDDDPEASGRNGYSDETEGVSLSSEYIKPNIDYRFESTFRVYSKSYATFEFGSQESQKFPGFEEADTIYFSPHIHRRYPWY